MKNNDEKIIETNASIRATSVESEIRIVYLQSFYSREQTKTHDYLNSLTIKPILTPINHSISSNIALYQDRVKQTIYGDDGEITTTVYFSHSIIVLLLLAKRYQD